MKKYDLIVVGGGFAGAAAAIAAARGGVRVLIVEKGNSFGGAAVHQLVNPFMAVETEIDGKRVDLAAGMYLEIREKLKKLDAREKKWNRYSFSEEDLKFIFNDMMQEAGVDILFHAYLSDVERAGDEIKWLTFLTRGGKIRLSADYYIDATGDAFLSYLAGVPTRLGREDGLCQPMTLCFRTGNVDKERFFNGYKNTVAAYVEQKAQGKIKNVYEKVLAFDHPLTGVVHFNSTRVARKNPVDPFDYTAAELEAREYVRELFAFLKEYADGMEEATLLSTGAELGVRESRMIDGEYLLTVKDCMGCVKFPDAIASCNYDIDIHNPEGSGTSHYYFPQGQFYTIPYRSLIPQGVDNLLVAGRCISSDHEAQASYRVMPTVCNLGEAAGTAAALAVKAKCGVRAVDISALQARLKEQGAFLG